MGAANGELGGTVIVCGCSKSLPKSTDIETASEAAFFTECRGEVRACIVLLSEAQPINCRTGEIKKSAGGFLVSGSALQVL